MAEMPLSHTFMYQTFINVYYVEMQIRISSVMESVQATLSFLMEYWPASGVTDWSFRCG